MSKVLNVFKISNAGSKRDSPDLLGLEIEQTEEGYQLVAPRRVLATTKLVNMHPTPGNPMMTFHIPRYVGWDWHINITGIDSTTEKMNGNWHNNDKKTPMQEADIWVATGSGAGEEEPGDQGAGGKGKGDDEARAAYASQ
jgi:hypothetical protein